MTADVAFTYDGQDYRFGQRLRIMSFQGSRTYTISHENVDELRRTLGLLPKQHRCLMCGNLSSDAPHDDDLCSACMERYAPKEFVTDFPLVEVRLT